MGDLATGPACDWRRSTGDGPTVIVSTYGDSCVENSTPQDWRSSATSEAKLAIGPQEACARETIQVTCPPTKQVSSVPPRSISALCDARSPC